MGIALTPLVLNHSTTTTNKHRRERKRLTTGGDTMLCLLFSDEKEVTLVDRKLVIPDNSDYMFTLMRDRIWPCVVCVVSD